MITELKYISFGAALMSAVFCIAYLCTTDTSAIITSEQTNTIKLLTEITIWCLLPLLLPDDLADHFKKLRRKHGKKQI